MFVEHIVYIIMNGEDIRFTKVFHSSFWDTRVVRNFSAQDHVPHNTLVVIWVHSGQEPETVVPVAAPIWRWPAGRMRSPEAQGWCYTGLDCYSLVGSRVYLLGYMRLHPQCGLQMWMLMGAGVTGSPRVCSWGACNHFLGNGCEASPLRSLVFGTSEIFYWDKRIVNSKNSW